jgi:23S rRNA (uridine2552-2'-O)-methyltransferase
MARRGQEDAYYHRAKKEGYAARSVYKLQEIDRRYKIFRRGQKVLDLGCHPGSWLQYAAQKVGPSGLVVGVDLQPPTVELPKHARFVQSDLLEIRPEELREFASAYDLALSDAAPKTTGIKGADVIKSLEITTAAVELGLALLKPGGALVAKVFYGKDVDQLIHRVKRAFKMGKAYKPQVTTTGSKEIYLLGQGYKGNEN